MIKEEAYSLQSFFPSINNGGAFLFKNLSASFQIAKLVKKPLSNSSSDLEPLCPSFCQTGEPLHPCAGFTRDLKRLRREH